MDKQMSLDLFNNLANEFRWRVRWKYWSLSNQFSDETLESIALSCLYEAWKQEWDKMRPFENFANTFVWWNFINELKNIVGRIPVSGLPVHPDSSDTLEDIYPSVPPAPTQEEQWEAEKVEELIDELQDAESKGRKDRILLARRRFLMAYGFGNRQGEGIYFRLNCDLHPDVYSVVEKSEVKWLAVLLRRHVLIKHGRSMISDGWIDHTSAAAEDLTI